MVKVANAQATRSTRRQARPRWVSEREGVCGKLLPIQLNRPALAGKLVLAVLDQTKSSGTLIFADRLQTLSCNCDPNALASGSGKKLLQGSWAAASAVGSQILPDVPAGFDVSQ